MNDGAAAVLVVLAGLGAAAAQDVGYLDASLAPDGRLLEARVHDVDGDGRGELVLAVLVRASGRREVRVHALREDGRFSDTPRQVVAVLDDVVAFGFLDARDEPGDELVLLTRSGAWSYSPTREGYRGNVERMIEADLAYDVADAHSLPFWEYVVDEPGRRQILLPEPTGYVVWTLDAEEGTWRAGTDFRGEASWVGFDSGDTEDVDVDERGLRISVDMSRDVLLDDAEVAFGPRSLLAAESSYRAPALVDVDGDGARDLVRRLNRALAIHLAGPDGLPAEPSREEPFPTTVLGDVRFALTDVDGDGDADVIVRIKKKGDGELATNSDVFVQIHVNDGSRILADPPDQLFRFEGADVRASAADVDGDGRPDLVVSKVLAPDLLDLTAVAELTFVRSTLVFLGVEGKRPFETRPSLRHEDVFDETTVGDAIARRRLAWDCSGDGIADVVSLDLHGRVSIHRVRRESSFFGGESWSLERAPWKRFDVGADLASIVVDDVNGDGLGDFLSRGEDRVTLLLSRRMGSR